MLSDIQKQYIVDFKHAFPNAKFWPSFLAVSEEEALDGFWEAFFSRGSTDRLVKLNQTNPDIFDANVSIVDHNAWFKEKLNDGDILNLPTEVYTESDFKENFENFRALNDHKLIMFFGTQSGICVPWQQISLKENNLFVKIWGIHWMVEIEPDAIQRVFALKGYPFKAALRKLNKKVKRKQNLSRIITRDISNQSIEDML